MVLMISRTKKTYPVLKRVEQNSDMERDVKESCIVPIENPSVDGFTGLLAARYFRDRGEQKAFEYVLYIRADNASKMGLMDYENVRIGRRDVASPYAVFTGNAFIPAMSNVPFVIFQLKTDEYDRFLEGIDSVASKAVLESMYSRIAAELEGFSVKDRRLVFPEGYANIRI
jgi:hypothetical protein